MFLRQLSAPFRQVGRILIWLGRHLIGQPKWQGFP